MFGNLIVYENFDDNFDDENQIIICESGIFRKSRYNPITFVYSLEKDFEKEFLIKNVTKQGQEKIRLHEGIVFRKKPPVSMYNWILRFFREFSLLNLEVKVKIWYDLIDDDFFIDIPFQYVTSVSVEEIGFQSNSIVWDDYMVHKFYDKYKLKQMLENNQIFLFAEIHSHHNMRCSFSSIDNECDFNRVQECIFGVFKNVSRKPNADFRYIINGEAKRINKRDIFRRSRSYRTKMKVADCLRFINPEIRTNRKGDFQCHNC